MSKKNGAVRQSQDLASLEKVRDLLLDSDRKEMEGRVARLEDDLRQEIQDNAEAAEAALAALSEALGKRLDRLDAALAESQEVQATRVTQAKASVRAKIDKVETEAKQRSKALRERLTAVSRKLREESSEREAQLLDKIESRLETVSSDGTSRHQLASLLGELAVQLGGES